MSGAGAASRVRATAGVTTVWGRALRAELVKVVTLPAMWWSAAVAGGAAVATMMSVLRDVGDGQGLGFGEVAPVWALAVQIGFVAAGVAAAGAEHSTAQGMTSLLVTPARGGWRRHDSWCWPVRDWWRRASWSGKPGGVSGDVDDGAVGRGTDHGLADGGTAAVGWARCGTAQCHWCVDGGR